MNRTNFPSAVVLINGFPGAGKFTIAQHMVSNHYFGLPDRVRFIDNHLLIDAVEAASPRHLHLPDYDVSFPRPPKHSAQYPRFCGRECVAIVKCQR